MRILDRSTGRICEPAPQPAEVVIQPMARNEARPDPAGNRLQLAGPDQRTDIVLGAAELVGDLADGERRRRVHVSEAG